MSACAYADTAEADAQYRKPTVTYWEKQAGLETHRRRGRPPHKIGHPLSLRTLTLASPHLYTSPFKSFGKSLNRPSISYTFTTALSTIRSPAPGSAQVLALAAP